MNIFSHKPGFINPVKYHDSIGQELSLKSEPFFDNLNKKLKYNISGYNENSDYYRYIDKNLLNEFNKTDPEIFDLNKTDGLNTLLIPHLAKENNQILVNSGGYDFEIYDVDFITDQKKLLAEAIILNWNNSIFSYNMVSGENIICQQENYTIREYFLENRHLFDISFRNTIDEIESFFKLNKTHYDNDNMQFIKDFITTHEVPENEGTRIMHTLTKTFEKYGKDENEILDCSQIVNDILDNFKN